jgi:uncharacterized protein YcbX
MAVRLTDIVIYPVKSCAGSSLAEVTLDRFGPRGDRRWMVVNDNGGFLTQRDLPAMCRIEVDADDDGIRLYLGDSSLAVEQPSPSVKPRMVRVWSDHALAQDAGDEAANWLSERLERPCRLVFMPEESTRLVDGLYAREGETVGFADGFPLLLISQASLDDLNDRLPSPVPMNRFRPNLVVEGCEPFAEDDWRRIRIGEVEFQVAKPCSRCVMPSIVQESAERDPDINRVLAGYRHFEGKVYFGQNLLYQEMGRLKVGDVVEVLE